MKVLHVVASLDPKTGGVCQAVRMMIAGLADIGAASEVVSLDAVDAAFLANDSFRVHALGPGRGPWAYSPQLARWLDTNLSRFDRVILHGLWLYPGYALHRALRRLVSLKGAKSPLSFVMPHGMLDPYFQRTPGRKLKAWRNWVYWKLIEHAVVNDAFGLLFTCKAEQLLARQPFVPYHPKRELVVGLGIEEPPPYAPSMHDAFMAKCPELRNRPYLLFLSRIHDKKGVDLLLKAYEQSLHNFTSSPTPAELRVPLESQMPVLVIAGPGLETEYGQQMQQLAARLPAHAIHFPGMLSGEAKWGAFYGCEAFILPSHQENFGIAVVEALACKKPVLISNQVNIWHEIETTGGGLVEENTLLGTQRLIESWCKMTVLEKQNMQERAQVTYQSYFALRPATEKLTASLQWIWQHPT